jgi:ABC-type glycerol-3-phosphate transport system substrate-binding protein
MEESMPDGINRADPAAKGSLTQRPFSRRDVLRGGLFASGAAFLAACGAAQQSSAPPTQAPTSAAPSASASGSTAPSASATPEPTVAESYTGITLHNFTGGYMIPWLDAGTAKWKAETGGDATEDNVTFEEKQIKQAGIIATQDSSYDMMYTTSAYGYIQKFAERLLLPVTEDVFGDLSDFFPNSIKALSSGDGQLRALPLYDFPSLWGWNKKIFTDIGEDPENPPDNYPALFALVPKFKAKGYIPSVQPWLATQSNLFALLYFTYIYNSTAHPMYSPDRTQLMFDGAEGKQTFDVIEEGFKSGFWDSKYMNLVNEHDAYKIFGDGKVATIRESESPVLSAAMADPSVHGIRQHPGVAPGTSGSTGGPDGLGVSKFSKNQDASWSWAKRTFGKEVELAAATTVKDSTGALVLYPVARTSVVADPAVLAAQPLQPLYQVQNKFQTDNWSTPYDTNPVFNEVIAKMISGEYNAQQAQDAAVKGVNDVIIKYLTS